MKNLCIYHKNCADGFGAALAVKLHFDGLGEECEFLPAHYGDEAPDVTGRKVIIVDFSYKRDVLVTMKQQADHLFVIDHHKTAEEDLKGLSFCLFDMTQSGAMLTWQYFHGDENIPLLIQYIQDRDLWLWKMPDSKQFSAGLQLVPMEFDKWEMLLEEFEVYSLIGQGFAITEYQDRQIQKIVNSDLNLETIGGYEVPCINTTTLISEIGNELSKNYPFAAMYFDTADKRIVSLRSSTGGVDVSEVAATYGGGGHYHAAGFSIDKPVVDFTYKGSVEKHKAYLKKLAKQREYYLAAKEKKMNALVPAGAAVFERSDGSRYVEDFEGNRYQYFGSRWGGVGRTTLSRIKMAELDDYIFVGMCVSTYGDHGYVLERKGVDNGC